MLKSKKIAVLIVLTLILGVLAACGDSGSNNNDATKSNETRTIKHALGETPITGTPSKIVVLEWTYAEDLLALGVQPAGVADIENMKKWMQLPAELSADTVDIGTRQEPNLEAITALEPDLIIGVQFRHEAINEQLSDIAPTIMFNSYPAEGEGDQYQEMVETFKTIADVVGKTSEADAVLADLQKTYDDTKSKLEEAGKAGRSFLLTMPLVNQNAVSFRISTDNALAVKVLEQIGLKNAYKSEQFEVYGFSTKDVEAFPPLQDADYLHITSDETAVNDLLSKNAVWTGLNFVKENRSYALGGDTWPYGGPHSAKLLAERVASVLLAG